MKIPDIETNASLSMSGRIKTANQTSYLTLLFVTFSVLKFKDYQYISVSLLDNVFLVHFRGLIPKGANPPHVSQMSHLQNTDSLESQALISLKNSVCVQACTRHGSRAAPLTGLRVAEATTQGPWLPGKNKMKQAVLAGRHSAASIFRTPMHSIIRVRQSPDGLRAALLPLLMEVEDR